MPTNRFNTTHQILVLKADRLCASIIQQVARRTFPESYVRTVNTMADARAELGSQPVDLLLTGLVFPDGDALDLLTERSEQSGLFRRALVVTGKWEHQVLATLRLLPIQGVFDPMTDGIDQLETAMRLAARGERYWSATTAHRLCQQQVPTTSLGRLLSPAEHLIFALIGDGTGDKAAARQLNLQPSTIHSVRRKLHRKLGVQQRGDLIRLAVQHGYVRFTADGVQRPGFSSLLAACGKTLRTDLENEAAPARPNASAA
jgi:DNA-binding NarL/FixJ family response regulator